MRANNITLSTFVRAISWGIKELNSEQLGNKKCSEPCYIIMIVLSSYLNHFQSWSISPAYSRSIAS
jgi:hypothetical protein